jgi:hypothetical protein
VHLLLGDDSLHRRRDRETKDQRPEDFPKHPEGEAERIAEVRCRYQQDGFSCCFAIEHRRPAGLLALSELVGWSLLRASPPRLAVVSEVATLASVKTELAVRGDARGRGS